MRSFIKLTACLLAAILVFSLSACDKDTPDMPEFIIPAYDGSRTEDEVGFQLELPEKGEDIAVIKTSEGTLKIRLFPESAPIGVANFKGLVNKGFYNGLGFHRIATDFVAQGGDPDGDGTGGKSLWDKEFETEVNNNLLHLRGAVAYANRGAGTNSSQFYFVTPSADKMNAMEIGMYAANDQAAELYTKYGGTPSLDYSRSYTVFGQVFEGLDVLDKINACGSSDQSGTGTPTKAVKIISATIEKY